MILRSAVFLAIVSLASAGCAKDESPAPAAEGPAAGAAAGAGAGATTATEDEPAMKAPETHELSAADRKAILEAPIATLDGTPTSLAAFEGKALLLVNVASKCGLTPQYTGLEELQKTYGERGFTVVGLPCNQFGGQEPGSAEEIQSFCSTTYGVTFPMMEKIEVNGDDRHPIYRALTSYTDAEGAAGDIKWNFEKFIISADRQRITRFRPQTEPKDPKLVAVLEAALPR